MSKKFIFFLLIIFLIAVSSVHSQGENLTLKIAVMGPGTELYFWFGHIGLIIEDSENKTSHFYDYGIFSFSQEDFFTNFAMGRLYYCCGVSYTDRNLAGYMMLNRSITIYTLDVPPEKKLEVKNFVDNNVLPENRDYEYHNFRDNCSTRIRDILNIITDGQFYNDFGNAPGRYTIRRHVRRHTWHSPVIDWGLNFWMGQVIDVPITEWEEMFLPQEVADRMINYSYYDNNGIKRKLVTDTEKVYEAENRPPILEIPRKQWKYELVFSLALSLIFGFFFYLRHKNYRAGFILSGLSMSICGLVLGFMSLLLYFLVIFTNHDYTYENTNMLFGTPILLAAVPLGICYAFTKNKDKQIRYDLALRVVWLLTVLGILVSMILKLFPPFYQDNLTDQLLFLPIALVFAFQPAGLKDVLNTYCRRKKGN